MARVLLRAAEGPHRRAVVRAVRQELSRKPAEAALKAADAVLQPEECAGLWTSEREAERN